MGLTPAKRFSDGIMSSGFSLRWQRRRRRRRRRSAESLEWTLPRPPSSQSSPVFSQQTDSAASSSSYISTLRDTRAEAEIPTRALSTGSHLISSRFNLASIHLWPVTAANSLALSIEPQKWPTPIAFAMRPARRRGRSVQSVWVCVRRRGGGKKKGEREREREAIAHSWTVCLLKCIKNHCTDGYDSPCIHRLWAISRLSGAAGAAGDRRRERWRGGGYLRRIRETWWMTQYFHARGKLLHFKLEGVTERGKEAEEEWNKSAGIKGLMRGGERFIAAGRKRRRDRMNEGNTHFVNKISLALAFYWKAQTSRCQCRPPLKWQTRWDFDWSHCYYYAGQYHTGRQIMVRNNIYTSAALKCQRGAFLQPKQQNVCHRPPKATPASVSWSDANRDPSLGALQNRKDGFLSPSFFSSLYPSFSPPFLSPQISSILLLLLSFFTNTENKTQRSTRFLQSHVAR